MDDKKGIRLHLYMARCGIASRRKCEEIIQHEKVFVNGKRITAPGEKVYPGDNVVFRGKQLYLQRTSVYIALNKPKGYVCTASDPENRPKAIDLVKDLIPQRLFTVGRLDYNSSGLIFLTNDGDFSQKVIHPKNEFEKEYRVETSKPVSELHLKEFVRGISVEHELLRIKSYHYITPKVVSIILMEGKNREIRRLFIARNMKIKKLHRVRIGNVSIKGISSGRYRHLKKSEVDFFIKGK